MGCGLWLHLVVIEPHNIIHGNNNVLGLIVKNAKNKNHIKDNSTTLLAYNILYKMVMNINI